MHGCLSRADLWSRHLLWCMCNAGMFGFFFTKGPVTCFEDAKQADTAKFGRFHRGMLEHGIYLAPSAYEVTLTHSRDMSRHTCKKPAACALDPIYLTRLSFGLFIQSSLCSCRVVTHCRS